MLTAARLREVLHYDPLTGHFTWRVQPGKRADLLGAQAGHLERGYITIRVDYQLYQANRLAWLYMRDVWPNGEIDHKNRKKCDNRWRNLRDATHQQNTFNGSIRSNNTSGSIGVSWDNKNQKWRAHITLDGKMKDLGRYASIRAARSARRTAEREMFGEFAPSLSRRKR